MNDQRSDLYLITHNTQNRQISMSPVGFETIIAAGERPQIYALDRAATGNGLFLSIFPNTLSLCSPQCERASITAIQNNRKNYSITLDCICSAAQ
jgi:hypothetical protein